MKKILFSFAAALCCTMTMTVMTACTDNDDNSVIPSTEATDQPVEPTEDALNVKVDGNCVVYGQLDHGFDQALQRRLQDNISTPMDADCFIIDMSVYSQNTPSLDEWKELVRRCQSGEASCVITQCTFKEFYNFALSYIMAALANELENYHGDEDPDKQAETRARIKQRMANVVRNAYIAAAQADGDITRSTEVNGQELDWENIDQWPKEKQNAIMFDAYAFCGVNDIYVLNAEASKYMNGEEADQPDTDYEWGLKADAVAEWLNRQRKKDDAQTRAGLTDFSRAVTRASGSTAISDLMGAQTREFVFDYKCPHLLNPSVYTVHSAIKVRYTVYSAYDLGSNVEYYQVRQNITVMNDKIFKPLGEGSWFVRSNDGVYNMSRGSWMKSINTKMWLEGSGTKSVVSVAPINENGTSSGSSTTGGSSATTEGWSVSKGYSVGGSAGWGTLAVSGSYNYAHTTDHSTTNEISWNTSTNWSTRDLTTVFSQGNDANASVAWSHNGYTPTTDYTTKTSQIKPLLKSTCITDEQVLWKIQNPSGKYSLKANFNVKSEIVKLWFERPGASWEDHRAFVVQDNPHDISFDLNAPDRYKVKWNNVIYDYGSITGDIQLTHYLDEYIEKTYGYNSANFCWAGLFLSTEATADGADNARAVFQTFKNSIRGMKLQLYQKGFRGQLIFGLKRDGTTSLTDKIVLDLDNLFSVGETLTEEVNGYNLIFKVTKNNTEVELSSVPSDFAGELVIPSKIQGNILTVTSLGKSCGKNCKNITAVTIPSTVHTIEEGALQYLNITEINIPEGVQTIDSWAFYANKKVTKVYLPSTLKSIGSRAFGFTEKLVEVHIKATTPPAMGGISFAPINSKAVLFVPKGCKEVYAQAKKWMEFRTIVEE